METTKIGVIGMGKMGTYHLRKYNEIDGCTVVGIVDVDKACVNGAADGYCCATHTDHQDLIGQVDAVSIAVPTSDHYRTAKDFLANGIDVLLEKPIAATLAEADEMLRLSKEHGAILQIGFIERFNPAITALADFLERPLFIESHRLHPFFSRGTDVDVVLDLMIHDLDIILHFVDASVSNVDATGIAVLSDEIDIANARITFANGCVANVTASRVTNKVMQKMRFFSQQGNHSVDFAERALMSLHRRFDAQGNPVIGQNPVSIKRCDPLAAEIRSFVQAVRTRQQPVVTGEDGRAALALSLEIINRMNDNLEHLTR